MNFQRPFTRIRHGCQVWSDSDCNNCNIVLPAVTSQVMKGVALSRVAIWNQGGALLPIALHCSAFWWQLTLEETWLQLGDEGGEGGCLPSNQTSLVALHWVAIDCMGCNRLHWGEPIALQNVPACIGFAMARQVSEGRSQVTNQTSSLPDTLWWPWAPGSMIV